MSGGVARSRGPTLLVTASAVGFALQGLALALWSDLRGWPAVLWMALPAAVAVCWLASRAGRRRCDGAHIALVAGLGGLAMLGGGLLEIAAALGAHRAHHSMGLWGWGTAPMLAVCIGSCLWARRRDASRRPAASAWPADLGGLAGMMAGMALGGLWLAAPLAPALDSMFAAHHLAMVAGMTLGTLVGRQTGRLLTTARSGRPPVAGAGTIATHGGR